MIKQNANIRKESKAVIYPACTISGYGHIFSLGIAGVHVVALSISKCENFRSRYVKEKHIVPDPLISPEDFVSWLIVYGKKQQIKPVLFLPEDVYAYIASLYKHELSPYYLYPYIDHDKLDIFFNKKIMFKEAEKAGIILPITIFSPLTDGQISDWNNYPAVMKPLVSRFTFKDRKLVDVIKFPTLFGGKAIQVSNEKELRNYALKMNQENIEYCVQQLIPGENKNIANIKFVSMENGKIPSCFISRKIRQQPADFGTCCVSQSEYIESLHEYAENFCKTTGYVGPGCMEFKWAPSDKKWYFIEINPRLDFWIRMSTIKEVNLPLQQYLLSTGEELFQKKQRNKGRYWIHISGDLSGLKWRRKKKEWHLTYLEILKPYLFFNEAIYNWKDFPMIFSFFYKIFGVVGKIKAYLPIK